MTVPLASIRQGGARLLKKPFFGRFAGEWHWPKDVEVSRWERVAIPSDSGVALSAVHGPAIDDARGSVVLSHPIGKAAKGFWLRQGHGELFRSLGLNVLAFDFNGFGESPSGSFDYPADVLAAGHWLRERYPRLPVGAVGASFGGAWTICAMARPHPFSAALVEGAFPTLAQYWRRYPFPYAVLRTMSTLAPGLERGLRPIDQAGLVVGTPHVTLLYGDADEITPPTYGEVLLARLRTVTTARMVTVPGADHTFALRDDADRYKDVAVEFMASLTEP